MVLVIVLADARRKKIDLLNHNNLESHWSQFKSKHDKKYSTSTLELQRYIHYFQNK